MIPIAIAGLYYRHRVESIQRHVAGLFDMHFPEFHWGPHVEKINLASSLTQFGKLPRTDGRDRHGELLSSFEIILFVWFLAWAGAELGSQAPLIQVFTPKRGSTHTWRMIQATKTTTGIRNSIVMPPLLAESTWVLIGCSVSILRSIWATRAYSFPPKRASMQAMMFARCGSAIW